jgi:glycosyltransferase involved in cell wall biosynthesis
MASGCPVINCEIPGSGVPWVCRHEEEGLTLPINDSFLFGMAARRILTETGLRERLANGGRRRAEKFGDVLMAQRSLGIYQQVLPTEYTRQPALLGAGIELDGSM